jgi:hypothetical protein
MSFAFNLSVWCSCARVLEPSKEMLNHPARFSKIGIPLAALQARRVNDFPADLLGGFMFSLRRFAVPVALLAAFLVMGCENEHPANIPENALLSSEGNGVLTATAPHDGNVYLYDVNADRVVYSGAIAKGQVVSVNTDADKVTIDGQVRADRTLNQWNKHRIYFDDTPVTVHEHITVDEIRVAPASQPAM